MPSGHFQLELQKDQVDCVLQEDSQSADQITREGTVWALVSGLACGRQYRQRPKQGKYALLYPEIRGYVESGGQRVSARTTHIDRDGGHEMAKELRWRWRTGTKGTQSSARPSRGSGPLYAPL